jgi:GPH family glycoside/pentoside/hexuronide:cation symporter
LATLPLRTKLLYASSSLGSEALGQSRGVWLVYFYAPPKDAEISELLAPGIVAGILLAARLIGAFDDILIGFWSDRTQSRWGRRIPFILAGAPFWVLFAFLLFTPPADSGAAATAVYLFFVLELFNIFSSLTGGPYEALLPELATTNRDRMQIVSFRVYFGAAGAAVGLALAAVLVDLVGIRTMALVMAMIALAFRYVGLAGVWSRAKQPVPPARISLREALRATFSNVDFLLFLPSFVLFQIAFEMVRAVLPFYAEEVLGKENKGTWVAILTGVAIVTMVVSIPFFMRLARRTSKRQAFSSSMLGASITFPLLFFAGFLPGVPEELQALFLMVLVGVPLAGVFLFPANINADIIDDELARTGLRREATYYGAQNFVERTATAVALPAVLMLLLLGRTAEDPLGIRLVGPVAGLFVFVGYLTFRRYRLPDEVPGRVPLGEGVAPVTAPVPGAASGP